MPNPNELLIKINGDAKNASAAFDQVIGQTEDLQSTLNKASIVGAAAFAALSIEVYKSVTAFGEGQQAANQLSQALQNQGIFTVELRQNYKDIAEAISKKTGVDDDQIVKAEAIAQSYLGQQRVSKDLVQAIVDLSTKTGGLNEAATLVGRSIGTTTNALARQGVVLREGSTQAERSAEVLKQVNGLVAGQAEAANKASFGINGLKNSFNELQKVIGENFAPIITLVATSITKVIDSAREHPEIAKFAAALIAGGLAASGLVAVAGPLFAAITSISAALVAAEVAASAASATLLVLSGAGVIGVLVAAAFYLATNWEASMLRLQAAAAAAVAFVKSEFMSFGEVVRAIAAGDLIALKDALAGAFSGQAIKAGVDSYVKITTDGFKKIEEEKKQSEEKQNLIEKDAADKRAAEKIRIENLQRAALASSDQVKLLQLSASSQAEIQLEQEKVALYKDMETEKNAFVLAAEERRLAQIADLQAAQQAIELDTVSQFEQEKQQAISDAREAGQPDPANDPLLQAQLQALQSQEDNKQTIRNKAIVQSVKDQQAANTQYLTNEQKFGVAYATIYQGLHSSEINATRDATGQLADLANSKNSTLKGIGKAAAIANITIDTARGALAVYANFQTAIPYPPVSIPLGLAAAAALTAYGAERISQVNSAATGALVGGAQSAGGTGDKHPFMLEAGELVAPAKNFNEVVDGVQTERSGIINEIRGRLSSLEANSGQTVNITVQGDVLAEESFITRLANGLSDAVKYSNQRLVASESVA